MKREITIGLLSFQIIFWGCSENKTPKDYYPDIVIKNNIQKQYDVAKFEIYKLSSNTNCSCTGLFFDQNSLNDTVNILSTFVYLDTLVTNGDTLTFYFSFYIDKKMQVLYIENIREDCFQCIGIQMINNVPFKAFFGEFGYFLYSENKERASNFDFINCVKMLDAELINPWLINYINRPQMEVK